MQILRMCLDWRVLLGLAVVGVGVYVAAPGLAATALPILLLAVCPLSMLFMMKAMQGDGRDSRTEQAKLAEQFDALKQEETRSQANGGAGGAENMAEGEQERTKS